MTFDEAREQVLALWPENDKYFWEPHFKHKFSTNIKKLLKSFINDKKDVACEIADEF